MRLYISIFLLLALTSCAQERKSNSESAGPIEATKDTTIVRQQNALNKSYEIGFYSKSISFYWLVGKDTIDFFMNVAEHEKDSTLHLNIYHKRPMLFTTLLERLNESLPLIKNEFDVTKFSSIYFRSPIYYLDLANELSREYEGQFGRKGISYQKLNDFLLNSRLTTQLDNFLSQLNKKVKRYSIEKFQFLDKETFGSYLPETDLKDYPEFTIDGMGVSIQLENK